MDIAENKGKILIVDSQQDEYSEIKEPLKEQGHIVHAVENGKDALEIVKQFEIDLIISSMLGDVGEGKEFLEKVNKHSPETEVIIITDKECYRSAVEAIKMGVYDYIKKPVKHQKLLKKIEGGLERKLYRTELKNLKDQYSNGEYRFFKLVSKNNYMQRIFSLIEMVAKAGTTVLVQGETGTGKELIARAIHANSERKNMPFVVVNCAALTETLLESELFGHEKGAFTGAFRQRLGRFELANKGTIFLDEVGDIPLPTQVKLLRVLHSKEFERVGGTGIIKCDTRIIGATNKDLKKYLSEGKFREDLYYRLNVFPINLPPLRERKDDIPLLTVHFIEKSCKKLNKGIRDISQEVIDILVNHEWPGNVREFENVIERSVLMERKDILTEVLIKPKLNSYKVNYEIEEIDVDMPFRDYIRKVTVNVERKYIIGMLMKYNGNIRLMSNKTNMDRKTVYRKIKEYGINVDDYRENKQ